MDAAERELTLKWIETWRRAGPELQRIRDRELAALTDERAREQSWGLLAMAKAAWRTPERRNRSGLVEQQAWFLRLRT
jgi:hypothetical protein